MPNCPRCLALTNDDFAYCAVCGRPRITESLRALKISPRWLRPVQQITLGVLSLWLVVTLGVAFLREAKAVRDARQLLAVGRFPDAWALLKPFLQDHPRHEQGLLLGGQATIRLGYMTEAKQSLQSLTELSPTLGKQLGDDYRQVLTERTRAIGCDAAGFTKLLGTAQELGGVYPASVTAGLDGVVEACHKNGNNWTSWQVASQLSQQGLATDLITKGYVPVISRALGQGQYKDAKALAQQAVQVAPAESGEIKTVLGAERAKVAATEKTLAGLCHTLQTDSQYHAGNTWCFPATAPSNVQTAKDGWGRAFTYTAFSASPGQTCHPGVALASYGATGQPAKGERSSPAAGISCRLVSGVESWQLPDRYWQGSQGAEGEQNDY